MTEPLTLEVCGISRGNPGLAGAGIVVRRPDGHVVETSARFLGLATPLQAEFQACVIGLELGLKHRPDAITLITAHETLWRVLSARTSAHIPEIMDFYSQAQELLASITVDIRHVELEQIKSAENLADIAVATRGRRQSIEMGEP